MLYPQNNRCRTVLDLSGIWEIKIDPKDVGGTESWSNGFETETYIGVPGSWNEQLAELGLMNYAGKIWYQRHFFIPKDLSNKKFYLRFGSADFNAKVWINGKLAGTHEGGYLPFEFDITDLLKPSARNLLIVCLDNILSHDTIPQGLSGEDFAAFEKKREETYPPTVFDFFAYGGIHRPVKLILTSNIVIQKIKVNTSIDGTTGKLSFAVVLNDIGDNVRIDIQLMTNEQLIDKKTITPEGKIASGTFQIHDCHFWSPETPHLYKLYFSVFENEKLVDEYYLDVGIREVKVSGDKLLLNGNPVFLKGFGKHEDFDVLGKGLSHPLIVKDFQLMKWIGANSFRTSHYPYAEEIMYMADKFGFLVIDEVPAVSLNMKYATNKTLQNHKKALEELIERDCNHPSVISWSIANEPGIWGESEAISNKAKKYWEEIYNYVKKLDSTRPVTLPTCPSWGNKDLAYHYSDFISVNRYWGWYEIPVDIEKASKVLHSELIDLYEKYKMPILISEFGADTIEGEHATYPQLFTEEYQVILIEKYFEVIESLPFTIGEHIWNFADFRTAQHFRRFILNKKGVFTRSRQPKVAAFTVRKHWLGI